MTYITHETELEHIVIKDTDIIYMDFETTSLDTISLIPLLLSVKIGEIKYVINLYDITESAIYEKFNPYRNNVWVMHNAMFDYQVLKQHYFITLTNIHCTMVCEEIVTNGMKVSRSYANTVARLHENKEAIKQLFNIDVPNIVLDKSVVNEFINRDPSKPYTKAELQYAEEDLDYLPIMYTVQRYLIEKHEMKLLYVLEQKVLPVLGDLELRGIAFDFHKHSLIVKGWENTKEPIIVEFKECLKVMHKKYGIMSRPNKISPKAKKYVHAGLPMFEDDVMYSFDTMLNKFKFNSSAQLLAILGELGYNGASTNAEELQQWVLDNGNHKAVELINIVLKYREIEKCLSTYGYNFAGNRHYVTGRMHPKYNQTRTVTGRLSSNKFNIQNLVKEVRECFMSSSNNRVLVTLDLSGQELRIAASLSQDPILLDTFNKGLDLHSIAAQGSYRIINNDPNFIVSKGVNNNLRDGHKGTIFSFLYGAGPKRVAQVLNISTDMAKQVINGLKKLLPGLVKYQIGVKAQALISTKLTDNAFTNRLKWIRGIDVPLVEDYKLESEACNFPIQSTGASMMKYAMVLVQDYIITHNKNWEILLSVHDELCVEVDKATFREDSVIIKELMEKAGSEFLVNLKMESEMVVSKYWTKNKKENLLNVT